MKDPRCLFCFTKLLLFRYRQDGKRPFPREVLDRIQRNSTVDGKPPKWGGKGDNGFCSQHCAAAYGIKAARNRILSHE